MLTATGKRADSLAIAMTFYVPPPTHQIALSFGFENSLYFVWRAVAKRLVLFMECC